MGVRLQFVLTQLLHPHWMILPCSSAVLAGGSGAEWLQPPLTLERPRCVPVSTLTGDQV